MNHSPSESAAFAVRPIGIIHSPFRRQAGTPIQAGMAESEEATATLFPEFAPVLRDLDGFDRAWLLCWMDRAAPGDLLVTPYLDTRPHGVFATRSPARPNPISPSCVRLLEVTGREIRFAGVDLLDGTPLLDVKPYVPDFDVHEARRCGWYDRVKRPQAVADDRFARRASSATAIPKTPPAP